MVKKIGFTFAAAVILSSCTTVTIKVPTQEQAYLEGCFDAGGTEEQCVLHLEEYRRNIVEERLQ